MSKKVTQSLSNLERALLRLEEATKTSAGDPLRIDGTIQRFEFTFDLSWKTIKRVLEMEGFALNAPREVLS